MDTLLVSHRVSDGLSLGREWLLCNLRVLDNLGMSVCELVDGERPRTNKFCKRYAGTEVMLVKRKESGRSDMSGSRPRLQHTPDCRCPSRKSIHSCKNPRISFSKDFDGLLVRWVCVEVLCIGRMDLLPHRLTEDPSSGNQKQLELKSFSWGVCFEC